MAVRSAGARRLLLLLLLAGSAASPAEEGGGRREAGGGEQGEEAARPHHDSSYGTFTSEFYDLRYLSEEGAPRGGRAEGRAGGGGRAGPGRAAAAFGTKASARRHLLPATAAVRAAGRRAGLGGLLASGLRARRQRGAAGHGLRARPRAAGGGGRCPAGGARSFGREGGGTGERWRGLSYC